MPDDVAAASFGTSDESTTVEMLAGDTAAVFAALGSDGWFPKPG